MGMSASQARLICLNERLNDIEYQGQQINQERTVLSQQCTDLYNSLLNMSVPTPPSTTQFTKTVYRGSIGSDKFTLGTVVPDIHGNGYTANLNYTATGHSIDGGKTALISATMPYVTVTEVPANFLGSPETCTGTDEFTSTLEYSTDVNNSQIDGTDAWGHKNGQEFLHKINNASEAGSNSIFVQNGNKFEALPEGAEAPAGADLYVLKKVDVDKNVKPSDGDIKVDKHTEAKANKATVDSVADIYIVSNGRLVKADINNTNHFNIDSSTGNVTFKSGVKYVRIASQQEDSDHNTYENPNYTGDGEAKYNINGQQLYSINDAINQGFITPSQYDAYKLAVEHFDSSKELDKDFMVYFTKDASGSAIWTPHFVLKENMNKYNANGTSSVEVFDYNQSGTYTECKTKEGCQLVFDADGRINEIQIPNEDGSGYRTVKLECSTETDEKAYDDAMNKYEYEKYLYDQKQQEINAKTSVIQQEDKNLELKLTRLDNERTQITTEIEAVKKVISDDIESSYKTFSG